VFGLLLSRGRFQKENLTVDIIERDAVGILEFCARHGLSKSTFHKLEKLGRGPRVMRVGAKCLVSREAAADWRAQMEQMPSDHRRGGFRPRKESAAA
jgi:hypothetical protein